VIANPSPTSEAAPIDDLLQQLRGLPAARMA